jgi:hypothetical protein
MRANAAVMPDKAALRFLSASRSRGESPGDLLDPAAKRTSSVNLRMPAIAFKLICSSIRGRSTERPLDISEVP